MKKTTFDQKSLNLPNLKLEIDTSRVRAYRLNLTEENSFTVKNKKHSLVLVSLNDTQAEIIEDGQTLLKNLKRGSFFVIKRNQYFYIRNKSSSTKSFVLLELASK
ncbi:MAG: hypothetical protein FJY21_01485 [Bacteroidetes bacterium]|nr:hypothetical protein [Bacteroidota bacterium]